MQNYTVRFSYESMDMTSIPSFSQVNQRLPITPLLAGLGALLLSACAQIPETGPRPEPKAISAFAANQSLAAPSVAWPADQWWTQYGDPQLDTLMQEALAASPTLEVAQARLRRADATAQQRDAARGPQLTGNLSVTEQKQSYNYLTPRSATPEGWNDYGRATLDFSYEFDFWGKNRAALAAATSERDATQADLALARVTLTTSIASAYADLARLFAERDTADAALRVRQETLTLFRQRFTQGLETQGSVKQMEARQAVAEAELLSIDESIGLQRNQMAALLGAGPDRGLAISRPALRVSGAFGLPDNLPLNLVGRRPDVVAARLRVESAAKQIDVAAAQFYPDVNLAAFIGLQSIGLDKLTKSGSDIGSVGPAITLPIFNSGSLKAQYRGSRAGYDEAVASYNGTLVQALHDVADATVSEKALSARLDKVQQASDAAADAYRIALNRYHGGLSSYLDVLTAEDTLLQNLRQLTDIQARRLSLDVSLVRALGGDYQSTQS